MTDNPFEIPQPLRDAAEQNLKQAHASYEQLTDFVTKAMGAWMSVMPVSPVTTGFKDVQDRAMEFAKENAESAFDLADKITKAQSFEEVSTLQTRFAQDSIKAFTTQMQELYKQIKETIETLRWG